MDVTKETFDKMLAVDKKTYEILASIQIFLADPKSRSSSKFAAIQKTYDALRERYNRRQEDYRNNTLLKISNAVTEYTDKTVQWFKDKWNSMFGIGAVPALVVPVAIAAGAVLSISALSYFIYKYFSETSTDYNEAFATIAIVAKENPELAEKMLNQLTNVKKQENASGFFSQAGQGVKVGIIAAVSIAALFGGYKAAKHYKFI